MHWAGSSQVQTLSKEQKKTVLILRPRPHLLNCRRERACPRRPSCIALTLVRLVPLLQQSRVRRGPVLLLLLLLMLTLL
jgi:hypothetical protein